MRITGLLFVLLGVFFVACNDVETPLNGVEYDYSYFPTDSGDWREYNVLHIVIDKPTDTYDTLSYLLREELGEVFIDATNDTMRVLNRYVKYNTTDDWILLSVWYMGIKENELLQVEENIKYVKQRLPLSLNKTWNGNAYNRTDTLNKFLYEVVMLDEPDLVNSIDFSSVLKVSQYEFSSLIEKYSYFEKYAKGVGLIEKEQVDIYTEDTDPGIPIEKRAEVATMYYQKIKDYGKAE